MQWLLASLSNIVKFFSSFSMFWYSLSICVRNVGGVIGGVRPSRSCKASRVKSIAPSSWKNNLLR
uniref:Haloacid dehalogenase-like hydrolase family protein n=1 Tax=Arundo donax TaxID=35708 RepID=A0A0A9EY36_ARUDO